MFVNTFIVHCGVLTSCASSMKSLLLVGEGQMVQCAFADEVALRLHVQHINHMKPKMLAA